MCVRQIFSCFSSGALNDILRRRNGSPHVAFSKTTSSVADVSPWEGTEAECSESETKTRANKTRVCLQRGGGGGRREKLQSSALIPELQASPGPEVSAVAAPHLGTLRGSGNSRPSDPLFKQQVTGGVSSIALKYTSLVVAFQRDSGTLSERQLVSHSSVLKHI